MSYFEFVPGLCLCHSFIVDLVLHLGLGSLSIVSTIFSKGFATSGLEGHVVLNFVLFQLRPMQ